MSKILLMLDASVDPIDRETASVLRKFQEAKVKQGRKRSLGFEPAHIARYGAVEVIQRRVRRRANGFEFVPLNDSYEAIVCRHPERFVPDVVLIAKERIERAKLASMPTADPAELEERVQQLLESGPVPIPDGVQFPRQIHTSMLVFYRSPAVKAFILQTAQGICEACGTEGPFAMKNGTRYLEVHHVKPLSELGSDRIENAVAVCPNCHRALHLAHDKAERVADLYARISRLKPE